MKLEFSGKTVAIVGACGGIGSAVAEEFLRSDSSMLAQAGESMTTVRDLLGHSSLIVTSRYSHMFDAGLDDIGSRLPSLSEAFCDQTATKH
ncbi:MAG: hypothetical protein R3229_14875 [Alphaproteobacteria bacterium]|nr:hypothetical protein [Alphaproteobacteria bacterium]